MNIKEKDLVKKAKGLVDQVGSKVSSGYWLAEGKTPGQLPSISNSYSSFVEGDGIYLALTDYISQTYFRATDGETSWTKHTFPGNIYRSQATIAYGDGVFVGKQKSEKKVYYSSDGITWTSASIPAEIPDQNEILMYGQDAFWLFGTSKNDERAKTMKSVDGGKTWQTVGSSGLYSSNTVGADSYAYDQDTDTFCAVCANDCIYTSKDGINWTQFDCPSYNPGSLCAGGGYLISGVSGNYTSSYGLIWYNLDTGDHKWIGNNDYFGAKNLYIGNGKFLILGNNGTSSRQLYLFDTSTQKVLALTSLPSSNSGDGTFIGSMGDKLIAYVLGDTYYGLTTSLWSADIDASLVDNTGTDKTGYIINAITGAIQTNTLDAAYAQGVNAYKGE